MAWEEDMQTEVGKFANSVKNRFKGGHPFINFLILVFVIALLWIGASCFFRIEVDEIGIVQRFGKYARTVTRGLNYKLPWGIEKLTKVKVTKIYSEEFGFRTLKAGIRTKYASDSRYKEESLMLTGDLNCGLVPFIVQYRIGDPYKYLFKVRDVNQTLRDMAEAVMSQVVGDRNINEVINRRQEIASQAESKLQEALNQAETGITVSNLELKKTNVPLSVEPSFNEVNQAVQEKEKMIYQAKEDYNKAIPKAKGEADMMISRAEGYALNRINNAEGDASRFLELNREYSYAKDVTRRRLYLETLAKLLPMVGTKYIIDEKSKSILPLLNIGKGGQK
ncbi:MAG: FtsH protease activity modulator HflK [bacterium]